MGTRLVDFLFLLLGAVLVVVVVYVYPADRSAPLDALAHLGVALAAGVALLGLRALARRAVR